MNIALLRAQTRQSVVNNFDGLKNTLSSSVTYNTGGSHQTI